MGTARSRNIVIGGGVTGLAAGIAGDAVVLEACDRVGGLCATYEMNGFRFEVGGGHWVWGTDPDVDRLLAGVAEMRTYQRRSGVFFASDGRTVPFPLQDNLWALDEQTRRAALNELEAAPVDDDPSATLDEWLCARFGPTLHDLFFEPFNRRYTAGLSAVVGPDDPNKSPVDLERVRRGAVEPPPESGYNASFRYPVGGLGLVADRLAARADVRVSTPVVAIDTEARHVETATGRLAYDHLVSTIALPRALSLSGIDCGRPDPHTSVLVVNIAARRGAHTPDRQWFYVPDSKTGFHRVGLYSEVDRDFLPEALRASHVSLYVEFAFEPSDRPGLDAERLLIAKTTAELQSWGWIGDVEVAHATWVDVAYTWRLPGSNWQQAAHRALDEAGVLVAGRYARWASAVGGQGIVASLTDGLAVGAQILECP